MNHIKERISGRCLQRRGDSVHSNSPDEESSGLLVKGLHGGYILPHLPENLPLLNVINAVDPIKYIKTCPLKLKTHGTNLCRLHKRLNDSIGLIEEMFRTFTGGTILSDPTKSISLCESSSK